MNNTVATKERNPDKNHNRFHAARLDLKPLPAGVEEILRKRYDMDTLAFVRGDMKWSESLDRVFLPIKNSDRILVGGTYRTLDPKIQPKSYVVIDRTEFPKLALYPNPTTPWKKIIIVEDQLSAIVAVSGDVSSAALCGCSASVDTMRAISDLKPEHVVICLDGDAVARGIDMHKKYDSFFNKCSVVKPPQDLKDMPRGERIQFLKRVFTHE